jgi:hypothetical protein
LPAPDVVPPPNVAQGPRPALQTAGVNLEPATPSPNSTPPPSTTSDAIGKAVKDTPIPTRARARRLGIRK